MTVTDHDLRRYAQAILAGQQPDPRVRAAVLQSAALQEELRAVSRDLGRELGREMRAAHIRTHGFVARWNALVNHLRGLLELVEVRPLARGANGTLLVAAVSVLAIGLRMLVPGDAVARDAGTGTSPFRSLPYAAGHAQSAAGAPEALEALAGQAYRAGARLWAELPGLSGGAYPAIRRRDLPSLEIALHRSKVGPVESLTPGQLRRIWPHLWQTDQARVLQAIAGEVLGRRVRMDGKYGRETFSALRDVAARAGHEVAYPVDKGVVAQDVFDAVCSELGALVLR